MNNKATKESIEDDSKKEEVKKQKKTAITDDYGLIVYQPNHVTFSKASFTIVQLKVLTFIMKSLQRYITPQVKTITNNQATLPALQLEIFKQVGEKVLVDIPKNLFVKSRNYDEFKKAIDDITTIPIQYPAINPNTGKLTYFKTTLFSVYTNQDIQGNEKLRFVTIQIAKETLEILTKISIQTDKKSLYKIDNYTNYLYHIAMGIKGYYAHLFYLYLSSWKSKTDWKISFTDLKSLLGIKEEQYKEWRDFRKRVLLPAQKELQEQAEIWFEFEKQDDLLTFKIITPATVEKITTQTDYTFHLLKSHFLLNEEDLKPIWPIVMEHYEKVNEIMIAAQNAIRNKQSKGERITSPKNYLLKAINNWYKNYKKT